MIARAARSTRATPTKKIWLGAWILSLSAFSFGCRVVPEPPPASTYQIPSSVAIPPSTPRSEPAKIPAITRRNLDIPESGYRAVEEALGNEEGFTLNVVGASLEDVLRIIAEASGRSITLHADVEKTVTASFQNAPLAGVLLTILEEFNLGAEVHRSVIRIVPIKHATVAFHLGLPGLGSDTESGDDDLWTTIDESLRFVLSGEGTYFIDREGLVIVVRDLPSRMEQIERILEQSVAPRRRQVVIEAMIVEIELTDKMKYGIDWSAPDIVTHVSGSKVVGSLGSALKTGAKAFTANISSNKISILLDALRERGQLSVLSAPRLTTLNRVAATFRSTEQIPYFETTFGAVGLQSVQASQVSFKEAGIQLDVTPIVTAAREVILDVHPVITELTGFTPAQEGLPPNPILDSREIKAQVRVQSGESLVLGGLIRRRYNETRSGVPGAESLPIVGGAFRNLDQEAIRTELVLIISPLIVDRGMDRILVQRDLERQHLLKREYTGRMLPQIEREDAAREGGRE